MRPHAACGGARKPRGCIVESGFGQGFFRASKLLGIRPARAQVLTLVAGAGPHIRSAPGWRTVCALLSVTALHPDAAPTAAAALAAAARPPALCAASYAPVLDAIVAFVERCAKVRALTLPAVFSFWSHTLHPKPRCRGIPVHLERCVKAGCLPLPVPSLMLPSHVPVPLRQVFLLCTVPRCCPLLHVLRGCHMFCDQRQ